MKPVFIISLGLFPLDQKRSSIRQKSVTRRFLDPQKEYKKERKMVMENIYPSSIPLWRPKKPIQTKTKNEWIEDRIAVVESVQVSVK